MDKIQLLIGVILALACAFACARYGKLTGGKKNKHFANVAEGVHEDGITRLTDAAITTPHLLFKIGSDANHIAVCGAAEIPMGTVPDEASAAEENVAVLLLGAAKTSRLMVPSETITAGEQVYTAASGKVQDLPGSAGTYYLVGTALTGGVADGLIEVDPCVPVKTVIA